MALKETITITVDEAGLKQLQSALKKTSHDVESFTGFLKEEKAENRRNNFVLRESKQSVDTLAKAFGSDGSGLIGTLGKTWESFDSLKFGLEGVSVAGKGLGGSIGALAGALGSVAIPIAVAGGAWVAYTEALDDVEKKHKELTSALNELKLKLGEMDESQFMAAIAKELDKLKEEGKKVGESWWDQFIIGIGSRAEGAPLAALIFGKLANDRLANQVAQKQKEAQLLPYSEADTRRRGGDVLMQIEQALIDQKKIFDDINRSMRERIDAEREINRLQKERDGIIGKNSNKEALENERRLADLRKKLRLNEYDSKEKGIRNVLSSEGGNLPPLLYYSVLKGLSENTSDRYKYLLGEFQRLGFKKDTPLNDPQKESQRQQLLSEMEDAWSEIFKVFRETKDTLSAYRKSGGTLLGVNVTNDMVDNTGGKLGLQNHYGNPYSPLSMNDPSKIKVFQNAEQSFGDVFMKSFDVADDRLSAFNESFLSGIDTLRSVGIQMWDDIFGEANSLFEKFMEAFTANMMSRAVDAGVSAILSLFPGGGLINALVGGSGNSKPMKTFHTGGVITAHSGMYLNAPSSQDIPIVARGGEMVLTEAQQTQLFNMANGRGSGQAMNITLNINAIDAKGVKHAFSKKDNQRELMRAISDAVNSGRMSW